MIIPKEVQCGTCEQVFCCAKCRQRHEDGSHQEATMIRKICYICNNRPFPLRRDTKITPNNLLIVHILKDHLPLRCNRCAKVFYTLEDFKNVNKCFTVCASNEPGKESECHLESSKPICVEPGAQADEVENKENFASAQILADDDGGPAVTRHQPPNTSGRRKSSILPGDLQPFADPENKIEEVDEALLTPLTKINLRWKRKSRQSFDSILSVTNNTSETNASGLLRVDAPGGGPAGNRRKLVRTTSTPMYQWQIMPSIMALKHPNESYSATMGQMSSIHCSSGSDTDSRTEELESPPQPQPVPPPPPPPSSMPDELNKVRAAIIRTNRSKAAATPLRQVMSKSIQRAIAQHTGAYSKMLLPGTQRKMSFNSTMSSGVNSMIASPVRDPLDLRTTPVLKRRGGSITSNVTDHSQQTRRENSARLLTQTASMDSGRMRMLQESQESNNNSSEPSEYYETHRDMDTLWSATEGEPADRENRNNFRKQDEPAYPRTPKNANVKKTINFDEPSSKHNLTGEKSIEGDDVWGTPSSTLPVRSFSCSAVGLGDTFKAYDASVEETDEQDSTLDEVFYPPPRSSKLLAMEDKDQGSKKTSTSVGAAKTQNGGRLWSIVSNVIRLASRGDVQEELAAGSRANMEVSQVARGSGAGGGGGGVGLVQRAVSFADYLKSRYKGSDGMGSSVRTSSSGSDEYRIQSGTNGKKRRRAATTVYSRTFAPATMAVPKVQCNSPVAKRKRIQARQPIQRLRNTSSGSGSSSNGMIG